MELNSKTYGIFWEPPADLQNEIAKWKEKIRLVEPEAAYLNHFVHCTFFLLNSHQINEVDLISRLNQLCNITNPIVLEFLGWYIFKADQITNGDTLVYQIKLSPDLLNFQKSIANTALAFKVKNIEYQNSWEGLYLASFERWGFPFVGSHWVPHLSVASVKGKGLQVLNEATSINSMQPSVLLNNLALYRIEQNQHIKLKTFQLKK